MQTKQVTGKRIAAIRQEVRFNDKLRQNIACVEAIILEDGTTITLDVEEWEADYTVDLIVHGADPTDSTGA